MTDLMELASRVEAGEGPDRDLDALIAPLQGLRVVDEGHPLGRCCYDVSRCVVRLPAYTASLDAAMSLVPAGHTVQLSDWDHEVLREKGPWQAIVLPLGARGAMQQFTFTNRCDHAATAPLALTAAALRARAHQGTAHVEQ